MREVLTGAANLSFRPAVAPSLGPRVTLTLPIPEIKSTTPISIPTITPEIAKPAASFFNTVEYKPSLLPSLDTTKPALTITLDGKVTDQEILLAPKVEVVNRETFNKPAKGFQFKESAILWQRPKNNEAAKNPKTNVQNTDQGKPENQTTEVKPVQKKAPKVFTQIEETPASKITETVKREVGQTEKTYQALIEAGIPDKEAKEIVVKSLTMHITTKLSQELKEEEFRGLKEEVSKAVNGVKQIEVVEKREEIDLVFERDPEADQERVLVVENTAHVLFEEEEVVDGSKIANSLPGEDQNPQLVSEIIKDRKGFRKLIDGSLIEIKKSLTQMGQFVDKLSVTQIIKALVKHFPAVRVREKVTTEQVTREDVKRVVKEMNILTSTP